MSPYSLDVPSGSSPGTDPRPHQQTPDFHDPPPPDSSPEAWWEEELRRDSLVAASSAAPSSPPATESSSCGGPSNQGNHGEGRRRSSAIDWDLPDLPEHLPTTTTAATAAARRMGEDPAETASSSFSGGAVAGPAAQEAALRAAGDAIVAEALWLQTSLEASVSAGSSVEATTHYLGDGMEQALVLHRIDPPRCLTPDGFPYSPLTRSPLGPGCARRLSRRARADHPRTPRHEEFRGPRAGTALGAGSSGSIDQAPGCGAAEHRGRRGWGQGGVVRPAVGGTAGGAHSAGPAKTAPDSPRTTPEAPGAEASDAGAVGVAGRSVHPKCAAVER